MLQRKGATEKNDLKATEIKQVAQLMRSDSCFYATYRAFINCFSSSSRETGGRMIGVFNQVGQFEAKF